MIPIKKLTYQEVKHFVETESNSGCKLLSEEYKNNSTNMLFQCKCGSEFKTTFANFKSQSKQQCNKCGIKIKSRKKSLSYEKVKYFIEVKSGSGCTLLSKEYKNNMTKMIFKCKCGNIFQTSFSKFKDKGKRQCNECSYKNRANKLRRTIDEFKKEIYERVGNEYNILEGEKYINSKTPIKMKHEICGYIWSVKPDSFLHSNYRCPQCNESNYNRDTNQFKQEVLDLTNKEYMVLGEYKNARTRVLVKHNIEECQHEWYVFPDNFLRGSRCPQCNISKGEEKIRHYLDENDINYKTQHTFGNLMGIGGGLLKFDFAVFGLKNNLVVLIEYDGEFHFEKQYSDDKFERVKIHDKFKNQYCKNNNIPLLRIPYWEFDNIEEILHNQLDNYIKGGNA